MGTTEAIIILIICTGLFAFFAYNMIQRQKMTTEEKQKFDEELDRKRKEQIEKKYPSKSADGQIKCPACDSTQIQMITRRWSFATGFFTNKVDRVCMNCKKRF